MATLTWNSAQATHIGNRRKVNEDAVLSRDDINLWAVADGMGGHKAGDRASREIIEALERVRKMNDLPAMVDQIEDALVSVNDALRVAARTEFRGQTIGSTVVALVSRNAVGVVLWAGDSRLYRLRGGDVELITRDHNPVCDLLDIGGVTEAQALAVDTNVVTRAVGGHRDLHLDVVVFDIMEGDSYLLCTDGLYREIPPNDFADSLASDHLDAAADALLEDVLAGDASDNVSFVILRVDDTSQIGARIEPPPVVSATTTTTTTTTTTAAGGPQ